MALQSFQIYRYLIFPRSSLVWGMMSPFFRSFNLLCVVRQVLDEYFLLYTPGKGAASKSEPKHGVG